MTESSCACPEANKFGARHVNGIGPLLPKIMILGEAPGADEDQNGVPFSGGAGRILDSWLGSVGIDRAACFIDNVVQHRPPDNKIDQVDLGLEVPSLFKRISLVNPNLVLLLGNTPLQVFVDGTISDWRGSHFPITVGGVVYQAMATYHPAFIMRQRRMWDVVIHDLKRARDLSQQRGYVETKVQYHTNPTVSEADEFLKYCAYLAPVQPFLGKRVVSVDIETDWDWHAIDMIGYCPEPQLAMAVPVNEEFMRLHFKFFGAIGYQIVTHNGPAFDAFHIRRLGLPMRPPDHDTMLYSHLIRNDLPHDLGFQCSIYTPYPYYKDQIKVRTEWYNCRDVDTTRIVLDKQLPDLRELGMI